MRSASRQGFIKNGHTGPAARRSDSRHVEISTITAHNSPEIQSRVLFATTREDAVINRMGIPTTTSADLVALHAIKQLGPGRRRPLGIKCWGSQPPLTRQSPTAASFTKLADHADYLRVLNVSGPKIRPSAVNCRRKI